MDISKEKSVFLQIIRNGISLVDCNMENIDYSELLSIINNNDLSILFFSKLGDQLPSKMLNYLYILYIIYKEKVNCFLMFLNEFTVLMQKENIDWVLLKG